MSDANTPTATSVAEGTANTPYAQRRLVFQFTMGQGPFGGKDDQRITIGDKKGGQSIRAQVSIETVQIPDSPSAIGRIYGLSLDHMNALSHAGLLWRGRNNEVVISAGDDILGLVTVYKGTMIEAYPDFDQPDAPFFFRGQAGHVVQLKPIAPASYATTTNVATALESMAKNAGWTLENNGVDVTLGPSYWPGTAMDQIRHLVKAANINASIDSVNGVLVIVPKTGTRKGDPTLIAPETGMIGYPKFSAADVKVRTLFGPLVSNLIGGITSKIRIKSQLKAANGVFSTSQINLNLASNTPGGPWEMDITCHVEDFGQGGG